MKNLVKKSIGVLLILLIMFSTLSGCVNPDDSIGEQLGGEGNSNPISNHTHVFEWVTDVEPTYTTTGIKHKECNCGEKTDENTVIPIVSVEDNQGTNLQPNVEDKHTHIYEWVTDVEPTYTTPGVKHKECSCGEKIEESTVVDRLLAEDIAVGETVDPTLGSYKRFKIKQELLDFYNDNKSKINKNFLCFDASSNLDKGLINTDELIHKYIYMFEYEIENNDEFVNPLIIIAFDLYVDEFSQVMDDIPTGGTSPTLVFYMEFYEITETNSEYQFIFHKYDNPKSTMKYVIEVFSNSECVGNIYYYQELDGEEISREWVAQYIKDSLFIIG